MDFPRIKEYRFNIDTTYVVPSHRVGRLHLIANDLYGEVSLYKPLAAANDIRLSMGTRAGVRPYREALKLELRNDGYNEKEITEIMSNKATQKRISFLDWNDYYDVSYGYISEVTEGLVLLVPSLESCLEYLDRFEFLKTSK